MGIRIVTSLLRVFAHCLDLVADGLDYWVFFDPSVEDSLAAQQSTFATPADPFFPFFLVGLGAWAALRRQELGREEGRSLPQSPALSKVGELSPRTL